LFPALAVGIASGEAPLELVPRDVRVVEAHQS
jgi:hypothetical protein